MHEGDLRVYILNISERHRVHSRPSHVDKGHILHHHAHLMTVCIFAVAVGLLLRCERLLVPLLAVH